MGLPIELGKKKIAWSIAESKLVSWQRILYYPCWYRAVKLVNEVFLVEDASTYASLSLYTGYVQ